MASIANRQIDRHEARSRPASGIHVGCVITPASPLTLTASSGEDTTERSCLPFYRSPHSVIVNSLALRCSGSKTLARHARARRGLARDGDRRSVRPERPEENRGQEVAIG